MTVFTDGVEEGVGEEGKCENHKAVCRDIRRYYCQYCGICRSKKSLIRSHVLAHHGEELIDADINEINGSKEGSIPMGHNCVECGATFKKPAHLKQHMLSHSSERYFSCPFDDCTACYKRKDHLSRHLLKHEGKLFSCPVSNCNKKFGIKSNMTRHVKEMHEDEFFEGEKQCVCQESGCGKVFKFPSKLKKHEESHAKLEFTEVICGEPGCMKAFTNKECLKAHIESCHRYVVCQTCGQNQLKKNYKRHKRIHEGQVISEKIKCCFEDCECTFSKASNLQQHIQAVHEDLRPFACRFSGCEQKFSYKHVRDNHEKSGIHTCVQGDFLEADELLRSRPRGGQKRKGLSVETLLRKRVVPLGRPCLLEGTEYLGWLLSDAEQD